MSFCRITLIGHLGHAPSLKVLPSGENVCNFSLATTETWKDKNGEKQQETTWFNIQVFGKTAEHCDKYLEKGSQVFIEGKLKARPYTAKTGETKISLDVTLQTIKFLSKNPTSGESDPSESTPEGHQSPKKEQTPQNENFDANDIPF